MNSWEQQTITPETKDRFEHLGFLINTAYLKSYLNNKECSPLDAFRTAWNDLLKKAEDNKSIDKPLIEEVNRCYDDVASFYSLLEQLAQDVVALYNVKWLKDAMESTNSNRSNSTPLNRI